MIRRWIANQRLRLFDRGWDRAAGELLGGGSISVMQKEERIIQGERVHGEHEDAGYVAAVIAWRRKIRPSVLLINGLFLP